MNRLKNETSPYLLQHAGNPVDWYPWGDEAFNASGMMGRPILLSIGYSACHWCHVMEKESFTDEKTAHKMNSDFINIKVDREERPDIDNIYMQAVQAITGRGGWPMTVFLLPDGRPFFGGSYFPPEPMMGLPSFLQVLDSVSNAYKFRRRDVEQAAFNIVNSLSSNLFKEAGGSESLNEGILHESFHSLENVFDWEHGGISGAPKFPNPMIIEFFLNYHRKTGNMKSLEMAALTLDRMKRGGIHDQVGGGFHRYSVDDQWLVPHFEKMLYDNAQLSRLYLHGWQATGKEGFKRTAEETYEYILREMTSREGGFYSSTDADSDGIEGKFFVWDRDELKGILGQDFDFASLYWGLEGGPNFEGGNILYLPEEDHIIENKLNLTPEEIRDKAGIIIRKLYEERNKRTRPGLDDKIVTSWSAMMTASLAEASRILRRSDYRDASVRAGHFIRDKLGSWEGRLFHTYKNGKSKINGFLDDYGNVIDAFIELYQATYDEDWLSWGFKYADYVIKHFKGKDGLFYDTGNKEDELFIRPRNIQDNALPSGNSLMARQLIRLWGYSGDARYLRTSENILKKMSDMISGYPAYFGEALNALFISLAGISEAVVIGDYDDPSAGTILSLLNGAYRPEMITAFSADDCGEDNPVPLLRNRKKEGGAATLYVCSGSGCSIPLTDLSEIKKILAG